MVYLLNFPHVQADVAGEGLEREFVGTFWGGGQNFKAGAAGELCDFSIREQIVIAVVRFALDAVGDVNII